jgi:cell shape-determining protein MreC
MWIFEITPNWLYHTLFFVSLFAVLVGSFLKNLSFIKKYALLLKWGGLAVLVIALFLEGALYDYRVMQSRIEEAKQQTAEYEQKNKELNDQLANKSTKVKEKIKVKKEYVTRYIDREVTKYDKTCVIPKEFVKAHNDSAEKAK